MPAIYTEYIRYIDAETKMAADAAQAVSARRHRTRPFLDSLAPGLCSSYVAHINRRIQPSSSYTQAGTPLTEAPSAMDPVTNSPITSRELIKCDAEEVAAYIAAYNMVDAPAEEGQGPETASK